MGLNIRHFPEITSPFLKKIGFFSGNDVFLLIFLLKTGIGLLLSQTAREKGSRPAKQVFRAKISGKIGRSPGDRPDFQHILKTAAAFSHDPPPPGFAP